jgi:hypothetical protein
MCLGICALLWFEVYQSTGFLIDADRVTEYSCRFRQLVEVCRGLQSGGCQI